MKLRAWQIGVLAALVLVAGLGVGAVAWRRSVERGALGRALLAAEQAVEGRRWVEARAILEDQARRKGRPAESDESARWFGVEVEVATGLRDFAALQSLALVAPEAVRGREEAALWLWRLVEMDGDAAAAETIRAAWRGRETMPVAWAAAEFDAHWRERRVDEARELVAAWPDELAANVALQVRRALVERTPEGRLAALDAAYRVGATDADLRALRGAVLERAGQPGFARVELVAALLADSGNPLRRDDLASFYLRQGDVASAVETWREGLDERSAEFLWVRAVFWGRVAGLGNSEAVERLGEGRRRRFAGWLAGLPEGRYWDEAGYAALALPGRHAETEPAVGWSRALERLRLGQWEELRRELAVMPATVREQAAGLWFMLRLTAAVRAGAEPGATGLVTPRVGDGQHRWLGVAAAAARGEKGAAEEFAEVARGPAAAVAAVVAAGWAGPALALADEATAATEATPGWLRYGLLQARRRVNGAEDALAWGERLPAYPPTDYTVASLRLAAGREAEAVPVLRALAAGAGDEAGPAAWLLGAWLLEQGRGAEVDGLLAQAPVLAATPEGKALRARAWLATGREAEADGLWKEIADENLEAGAYVARAAFARGDWPEARKWTQRWLERLPDNLQLRANLRAIDQAEQAAAGGDKNGGTR